MVVPMATETFVGELEAQATAAALRARSSASSSS